MTNFADSSLKDWSTIKLEGTSSNQTGLHHETPGFMN